jgi:hypothetical protein
MNTINLHTDLLAKRRVAPFDDQKDSFQLREDDIAEGTATEGAVHFAAKMHMFYELSGLCSSDAFLYARKLRPYTEYTLPKQFFREKTFSWAKLNVFKQCKWHHFALENGHTVPLPSRSDELFGPRCFVFDIGLEDADRLVAAVEIVDTSYPTEGKKTWCRFHDVALLTIHADWLLKHFVDTDITYIELEDGRRAPLKTLLDESTWYQPRGPR